jgi:hypothetical protein
MAKNPSFVVVAVAALATAAGMSCSREAKQTEAARTTTEQGTSVAPPAKEAAERDAALVRAVNAAPQTTDIYADDLKLFSNLEYKTVTPYKEIRDNEVTFKLEAPGSTTASDPMARNQEMLMDGRHYTVVALPNADQKKPADLRVLSDELVPPDPGKVKVRVVNATRMENDMDVMVPGKKDPVITDVGTNDVAGYKEIDPVAGKLIFRDDKRKTVVAEVPATLESGKLYTVFVIGNGKAGAAGKAEAVMVQDELTPAAPGMSTAPGTPASPAKKY